MGSSTRCRSIFVGAVVFFGEKTSCLNRPVCLITGCRIGVDTSHHSAGCFDKISRRVPFVFARVIGDMRLFCWLWLVFLWWVMDKKRHRARSRFAFRFLTIFCKIFTVGILKLGDTRSLEFSTNVFSEPIRSNRKTVDAISAATAFLEVVFLVLWLLGLVVF